MAGEMGNEFSGLPMGDLIGAPLNAACDAQIRLAKATQEFIETVGFNTDDKGVKTPRQVDFSFWRPIAGGAAAIGGENARGAQVEKVSLSVPFLAIVNVPALAVKSVDIVFDMEVKTAETSKAIDTKSGEIGGEISAGWGPVSAKVNFKGAVSSHKENTRSTDKSAKYHVEVHARDEGMPEGLARVLDILQSAIAPHAISAPTTAEQARLTTPPPANP